MFAISRPGNYWIELAGNSPTATGGFEFTLGAAGDVNGDGFVDGIDSGLLDAVMGIAVGDPAYTPTADADGNGVTNSLDQQLFGANFGFVSGRRAFTTPTPLTLDLEADSDTGAKGDGKTAAGTVTLVGRTAPGASVRLAEAGLTATADAFGNFVFAGVALGAGTNRITARSTDEFGTP
ncbi:MAG: hypothetical protein K2V38_08560, partial [Gemmataceae bacterium]|nr:hypothetical protein [Gemmataceae bacterium]